LNPIVYSLGSNKQQDFETAFLKLRPDSNIFTFELAKNNIPDESVRNSRVKWFNIGLGYTSGLSNLKTLTDMMKMLNHTYIDVLKMDIEGLMH